MNEMKKRKCENVANNQCPILNWRLATLAMLAAFNAAFAAGYPAPYAADVSTDAWSDEAAAWLAQFRPLL